MTRTLRRSGAAFIALLPACAAQASGAMNFCVDQGNPLYHIDRIVADAVAHHAGATVKFTVFDSSSKADEMKAQQPKFFVGLAARCDFIMGFPVEAGYPTLPKGLRSSVPYAVTGYVLAARGVTAPHFSSLAANTKVGTSYLSVPSTWFEDSKLAEHVYSTPARLYAALADKRVDAALIWQPWLVRELAAKPAAIASQPLKQPHAVWNVVALYKPDHADAKQFDAGIAALNKSGRLAKMIRPYAVPHS